MARIVHLRMLGTDFCIDCEDDAWADLLRRLWEPFVVDQGAGEPLAITRRDSSWCITSGWHPDLVQDDPWVLANELRHLLVEEAIARSDYTTIHAAALTRDKAAVVIVGASGAGKTTLTFELSRGGWEYATDDLVVLDDDGSLHPFPKPLGVKEPSEWPRYAQHLERLEWPGAPTDLFLVPPRALRWRAPDEPCVVTAIVFLERGQSGKVSLQPVTPGRAVADLAPFARPIAVAGLGVLARLCARARCAHLVSDDPAGAAEALEAFLG